jgi:hypothetical protein
MNVLCQALILEICVHLRNRQLTDTYIIRDFQKYAYIVFKSIPS